MNNMNNDKEWEVQTWEEFSKGKTLSQNINPEIEKNTTYTIWNYNDENNSPIAKTVFKVFNSIALINKNSGKENSLESPIQYLKTVLFDEKKSPEIDNKNLTLGFQTILNIWLEEKNLYLDENGYQGFQVIMIDPSLPNCFICRNGIGKIYLLNPFDETARDVTKLYVCRNFQNQPYLDFFNVCFSSHYHDDSKNINNIGKKLKILVSDDFFNTSGEKWKKETSTFQKHVALPVPLIPKVLAEQAFTLWVQSLPTWQALKKVATTEALNKIIGSIHTLNQFINTKKLAKAYPKFDGGNDLRSGNRSFLEAWQDQIILNGQTIYWKPKDISIPRLEDEISLDKTIEDDSVIKKV